MFDRVAERYDLLNDALSLGMDRRWRRIVARAVDGGSGQLVLDLAAGTGTSSRTFSRRGARCVACDFSLGMLAVGASFHYFTDTVGGLFLGTAIVCLAALILGRAPQQT